MNYPLAISRGVLWYGTGGCGQGSPAARVRERRVPGGGTVTGLAAGAPGKVTDSAAELW